MSDIIDGTVATEKNTLVALNAKSFNLPAPTVFEEKLKGEYSRIYKQMESEIEKAEVDLSTGVGRKAVASRAFSISKMKVEMTSKSDLLVADQKEIIKAVTGARKEMEAECDRLRDLARKPLTDLEAVEKVQDDRAATARKMFMQIRNHEHMGLRLDDMAAVEVGGFHRHLLAMSFDEASYGVDNLEKLRELQIGALDLVEEIQTAKVKSEADAAELENLRKMAAELEERKAEEQAAAETKARQDESAEAAIDSMEGFAAKWTVNMVPIGDCSHDVIATTIQSTKGTHYTAEVFGAHNLDRLEKVRAGTIVLLDHMFEAAEKKHLDAEKVREDAIRKEAADKATKDAEDKAEALAEQKLEAEAQRVETERKQVEQFTSARLEAYQEDHDRDKAIADRKDRVRLAVKKAEDDLAEEHAAETKRRAADKDHRREINGETLKELEAFAMSNNVNFDIEQAKLFIRAAGSGATTNLKMEY